MEIIPKGGTPVLRRQLCPCLIHKKGMINEQKEKIS